MIKLIIDNNVIISHLMTRDINIVDKIIILKKQVNATIYLSKPIWDELSEALDYPKLKQKLISSKTSKFIAWYKYNAIIAATSSQIQLCRDLRDNKFLELARELKADYLISGDQDLLELREFEGTKILKPTEFIEELQLLV